MRVGGFSKDKTYKRWQTAWTPDELDAPMGLGQRPTDLGLRPSLRLAPLRPCTSALHECTPTSKLKAQGGLAVEYTPAAHAPPFATRCSLSTRCQLHLVFLPSSSPAAFQPPQHKQPPRLPALSLSIAPHDPSTPPRRPLNVLTLPLARTKSRTAVLAYRPGVDPNPSSPARTSSQPSRYAPRCRQTETVPPARVASPSTRPHFPPCPSPPRTPTPAAPGRNREVADFSSPEKSPEAVEVSSQVSPPCSSSSHMWRANALSKAQGTRTSPIQRLFGEGRMKRSRQNEPAPVQHDHDEGTPGAGQGEGRDAEEATATDEPSNGGSGGGLDRAFRTWSGQSGRSKKKSKGRLTLAHLLQPLQPQEVEPGTGTPGPSRKADAAQQQAAHPRSVASASSAASRAGSLRSLRSATERMKRDEAKRLEVQREYARHGGPSPQIVRITNQGTHTGPAR